MCNHRAFYSLDLNNPRVSKHSRDLELSGWKRPWQRASPLSFPLLPRSSDDPARSPRQPASACSRGRRVPVRTRVQPVSYGTWSLVAQGGFEASRLRSRKHDELQSSPHELEKLKRSWWPRARWAVGPQGTVLAGNGRSGHPEKQMPGTWP